MATLHLKVWLRKDEFTERWGDSAAYQARVRVGARARARARASARARAWARARARAWALAVFAEGPLPTPYSYPSRLPGAAAGVEGAQGGARSRGRCRRSRGDERTPGRAAGDVTVEN